MVQDVRTTPPAKKLRVKVYRDGEAMKEYDLKKDDLIIGRDRTADIQLPSQAVSRRHARLTRTSDGWQVADVGAANGVFVSRDGGEPERVVIKTLKPGDVIVVETFSIKVKEVDDIDGPSFESMNSIEENSFISKRTQFISMVDVLKATERPIVPPVSGEGAPVLDEPSRAPTTQWWAKLESSSGHQRVFAITGAKVTAGTGATCEIHLPSGPSQLVTLERTGPVVSLTRLPLWPFPRVMVDGESVKSAILEDGQSFSVGEMEISIHLNGAPSRV